MHRARVGCSPHPRSRKQTTAKKPAEERLRRRVSEQRCVCGGCPGSWIGDRKPYSIPSAASSSKPTGPRSVFVPGASTLRILSAARELSLETRSQRHTRSTRTSRAGSPPAPADSRTAGWSPLRSRGRAPTMESTRRRRRSSDSTIRRLCRPRASPRPARGLRCTAWSSPGYRGAARYFRPPPAGLRPTTQPKDSRPPVHGRARGRDTRGRGRLRGRPDWRPEPARPRRSGDSRHHRRSCCRRSHAITRSRRLPGLGPSLDLGSPQPHPRFGKPLCRGSVLALEGQWLLQEIELREGFWVNYWLVRLLPDELPAGENTPW